MRPQVGQVINNKYRLLRLIGDGGMGSVYEARHEVLGTSVALKFLHPELSRRPGLVQRFLQEARVSARVQSPHVVRVTDVDQANAFIVMELLEGKTLQTLYEDLYRAGLTLSYPDALEYAMQMLEGVAAAHEQGIVHRDLKPDNVMITLDAKGRPLLKLLDFGIAKLKASDEYDRGLTRPGVIMGTPEYMAPEQAFSADAVDARADIFSLGVMIFEMLAGRRPVGGDEPRQIAGAYLSGRIAQLTALAPSIAPDLAAAVHRAMAPLVKDRWQSVSEFRDALEPFAAAARAPSALPVGPREAPGQHPGLRLDEPGYAPGPQRSSTTPEPAAATPPATNVGAEALAAAAGAQPVPRTLPPADGEPRALDPAATNPADPPVMSVPKSRGPTPLGGFSPAEAGRASAAAFVPATKSASPYIPDAAAAAVDPAATAFATPLAPLGSADVAPALDLSPRPSGTAIGDAYVPVPAPADPPFPVAPYAPPPVPGAKPRAKPPKGVLSSLPAILLLAAGVAVAVVGGVYLAQSRAKVDDHEDPLPAPTTTATVRSDPPPDAQDPPAPSQTAANKPAVPPQQIPRKPLPPAPKGSGSPNQPPSPGTSPSNRPPVIPSVIPPIVIPSTFPFGFPFGDAPPSRPEPPRTQPDSPRRSQRDPQMQPQNPGDPWGDPRPRGRPRPMPDGPPDGP